MRRPAIAAAAGFIAGVAAALLFVSWLLGGVPRLEVDGGRLLPNHLPDGFEPGGGWQW